MLYIILIIVAVLIYLIYRNTKIRPENNKQVGTEEILRRAQENKEKILNKCKRQSCDLYEDEIDMIETVETDIFRLCERYKHDQKITTQVLNDYLAYTIALLKIINANILDDAKSSVGYDDSFDSYHKKTKEPKIIIQEIGKRIIEMIGQDSSYKIILDKPSSSGTPADKGKIKIGDRYK